MKAMPAVVTAFVAPDPEPARMADGTADDGPSCPIRTPSYEPYQGYLGEAPSGINAPAAWSRPGGAGQGRDHRLPLTGCR
jgi:hypothetical protein